MRSAMLRLPTLLLFFAAQVAAGSLTFDAREVKLRERLCRPDCTWVTNSYDPAAPFAHFESHLIAQHDRASQVSRVSNETMAGQGAVRGNVDGSARSGITIEFEVRAATPIVFEGGCPWWSRRGSWKGRG